MTFKDAIFKQKLNEEWSVRSGYASVPFGYEVEYSSPKRLPLERTRAANLLFPRERDNGVYFLYTSVQPRLPKASVGYSNGVHEWRKDDNEDHAFVVRLDWPLLNRSVAGVSYMNATRTREDGEGAEVDLDNSLDRAHVRWNGQRGGNVQAEAYDGKLLGVDVSGWYVLGEWLPKKGQALPFYRYDTFDEGNPAHGQYRRHTAGAAWEIAKHDRVNLQWESYEDGTGGSFDNLGLQTQFSYYPGWRWWPGGPAPDT